MAQSMAFASLVVSVAAHSLCSLNGNFRGGGCECDDGWKGESCSELDLEPANPEAFGHYQPEDAPTWGGGGIFEDGQWHIIVGSRAQAVTNATYEFYPCNSKIVRAVSAGADAAGPYSIEETLFERSTWEPNMVRAPGGELIVMFYGNLTDTPALYSDECISRESSLLTHIAYISVSHSGSVKGPWTEPQEVKGMESRPGGSINVAGHGRRAKDACDWQCANGNPGMAFHPNGTLFASMRSDTCSSECSKGEHISLWRADGGWDGEWTLVSEEPVFGWGNASEFTCHTGKWDDCLVMEDPYMWIDGRGWHMLTHYQNGLPIHKVRGGYGWSLDGLSWTWETMPRDGNTSAWELGLSWSNGTFSQMARRQRPQLIWDEKTGRATHVIQGADFVNDDGTRWGTGFSLVQALRSSGRAVMI